MHRPKISEDLVLEIKKKILAGEYAQGTQLPSERTLAAEYNVSRIPVREAIDTLVKENILYTKPQIGTFVNDSFDASYLSQSIPFSPQADEKILTESLKIRQLVESKCAKSAALHATDEDVKAIQEALFSSTNEFRLLKQHKKNLFFEEDYKFHLAIASASHSDLFSQYLILSKETITFHQYYSVQHENSFDAVPNSHFRIYNAILSHNPGEAEAEMFNHLQRTSDLIL